MSVGVGSWLEEHVFGLGVLRLTLVLGLSFLVVLFGVLVCFMGFVWFVLLFSICNRACG